MKRSCGHDFIYWDAAAGDAEPPAAMRPKKSPWLCGFRAFVRLTAARRAHLIIETVTPLLSHTVK
jgi:hypothetical protein